MVHINAPVTSIDRAGPDIYVMAIHAAGIALNAMPGQFINVRIHDLYQPLLRRPFSIYRVTGETLEIIFNRVGVGTNILSEKKPGDLLDVIGPLGCSFDISGDFDTALLVGGGMGVAPLPILTNLVENRKRIATYLGARSKKLLITTHLQNVQYATDDGSLGFNGTVVDLLRSRLRNNEYPAAKIFACGPNAMLKGISMLAAEFNIPCEISLESVMACGVGICQGCPVENADGDKKYSLICKDGPVFNSKSIVLT